MSRQVDQSGNDVFSFFEGKVVLVLGAGATGVSIVRWLTLSGATVVLADSRETFPGFGPLQREFPEITVRLGPFSDKLFTGADLVVSSPGVPLAALPLEKLKNQDIPIVGLNYKDESSTNYRNYRTGWILFSRVIIRERI